MACHRGDVLYINVALLFLKVLISSTPGLNGLSDWALSLGAIWERIYIKLSTRT